MPDYLEVKVCNACGKEHFLQGDMCECCNKQTPQHLIAAFYAVFENTDQINRIIPLDERLILARTLKMSPILQVKADV